MIPKSIEEAHRIIELTNLLEERDLSKEKLGKIKVKMNNIIKNMSNEAYCMAYKLYELKKIWSIKNE